MKTLRSIVMSVFVALLLCDPAAAQQDVVAQQDWLTDYEKSGYVASPRYEETLDYLRRLADASPWIQLRSFGVTPQGRDLPIVILSRDGAFTPSEAHRSGRDIILIQSGIHAGEIGGKDAGLMLLRDIAITKELEHLADNTVLLFMPIFNLDGHERQSPYNRINQNGPESMGWRVTSNNFNLNRDFLKADAPEMRDWLRAFNLWMPDMVIDCHVTDGIDFQYNLSFATEMFANEPPEIVSWQGSLIESFVRGMSEAGDPVVPYVFPRERNDILKGVITYAAPPRFSTGYAAVRNRASLLVETHMMKPYRDRVTATYRLLIEVLKFSNSRPGQLHRAVQAADARISASFDDPAHAPMIPLTFRRTENHGEMKFLGYEMELRHSDISGGSYPVWHHDRPVQVRIPLYDDVVPAISVRAPHCYLIPPQWRDVVEVLRLHGVKLKRLGEETSVEVQRYIFSNPEWRERPYESRHRVTADKSLRLDTLRYPGGTWVIYLNQPSAHAVVHLLEPDGPDSFLQWGFFNQIFERKEYFESYVMEAVAAEMLAADPELKAAFDRKLASDTAFASGARRRLSFFYERSPWYDKELNVYPVARCLDGTALPVVEAREYRRRRYIPESIYEIPAR